MTDAQKDRIRQMKADGFGYIKIARELGLPENTVKSFCRREGLNRKAPDGEAPVPEAGIGTCPCCGGKVAQNPGRKAKRFCSDKCRNTWWNSRLDQVERKAHYEFVCAYCKKPFTAYGNAGRKYCSHECYVISRIDLEVGRMQKNKNEVGDTGREKETLVPVCEKYALTIKEAAAYFNIGIKKMRRMAEENTGRFSVFCGNKYLIIRPKFEKFIDESSEI